ncbi:MAG: nucleotide sugar dehydrogenase [Nanoarchaeota archaeon]
MFSLCEKTEKKEATISIIGLGYVGLPLALAFSKAGFQVTGFDTDEEKVRQLNSGNDANGQSDSHEIKNALAKTLQITSYPNKISTNFVIICVPTPVDEKNKPYLKPIESASEIVGKNLKKGSIVILESTVYPGITEEVMKPILESGSGLKCGTEFSIAYSPERINPGDTQHKLENVPKIVGGYDHKTTETVSKLYESIIKAGVYKVSSIRTAEAVKVVENTQRFVNISLINELAVIFDRMGINTLEVIEAAKTKWNFHHYYPNAGVGGHCISVDPYYLIHKSEEFGYKPKIISSSMEINEFMPKHVANAVLKHLDKTKSIQKKILLLGLTYKENVSDIRNTSAEKIAKEFAKTGIKVYGYDSFLTGETIKKMGIIPVASLDEMNNIDCFLFLVAHDRLKNIPIKDFKRMSSKNALMFDIKGILNKDLVKSFGLEYKSL